MHYVSTYNTGSSNIEMRGHVGHATRHPDALPLPALALVCPCPILAVGFLHKGVGVLGLGGPPGETLLQLVLQRRARGERFLLRENAQNLVPG